VVSFTPGLFTSWEIAPCTHWIEGWVVPRAGLGTVLKKKKSRPCRESNPGRPAHSPSLSWRSCPDNSSLNFFLNLYSGGWKQGPLDTAATNRSIVPAPGDYDDGEIGGMFGKGNRSTRRIPAPVSLCLPQTPHAARTRTRAAAVGSQRPTAWATARP
jgi:hypothetical protein